jgi:hypothetical protein
MSFDDTLPLIFMAVMGLSMLAYVSTASTSAWAC